MLHAAALPVDLLPRTAFTLRAHCSAPEGPPRPGRRRLGPAVGGRNFAPDRPPQPKGWLLNRETTPFSRFLFSLVGRKVSESFTSEGKPPKALRAPLEPPPLIFVREMGWASRPSLADEDQTSTHEPLPEGPIPTEGRDPNTDYFIRPGPDVSHHHLAALLLAMES